MRSKNQFAAFRGFLFMVVLAVVSTTAIFAQDSMKSSEAMKMEDATKKAASKKNESIMSAVGEIEEVNMDDQRPVVAIIAADWCPYCKKVDPVIASLKPDYGEKMNFVVFDVTNEKTTAAAKEEAAKLGLSEFFNENKSKTSTVAVLKDNKVVYKTSNNGKKDDYVKAFDKALQ